MIQLWQIKVPTIRNDGRPITTRFHRVFDRKVLEICKDNADPGLSIAHPGRGKWLHKGTLYAERMIAVEIACTEQQINDIADFAAKHYEQLAVMFYRVSDYVVVKHYQLPVSAKRA